MKFITEQRDHLREYYGRVLQGTSDLKTNACCSIEDTLPLEARAVLPEIHDEILDRYYGCGSPIPPALVGCTVLDLGCGTGRDVYIISRLVGRQGFVIGVDMTDEQLRVGTRHLTLQMDRFGYESPNVSLRQGFIEDLAGAGIEDGSIDVVVSNCVINLSPNKGTVFSEIFRVLRPGGELYFSDIFAGRRVPEGLREDPILQGECLAGALYVEDFRRILAEVGCLDYRVVSKKRIGIDNPDVESRIGMIDFHSMTVRAFKLADLEDICEDYGQIATYRGTLSGFPHFFDLDDHHRFIAGKPMLVCGNTASMLEKTRYAEHFVVKGDRSVHFGPFDCTPPSEKAGGEVLGTGGACC